MIFEQVPVGSMENFSYIIGEEKGEALVVDPAFDLQKITSIIKMKELNVTRIILTHNHSDHVSGAMALKARTGALVCAFQGAEHILRGSVSLDEKFLDGQTFLCGKSLKVFVLHTPGHTPDGICLVVDGTWLITGDTLFIGNCGRADLPQSSSKELFKSLQRIKQLPDSLIVCPGHDYGPAKTRLLSEEKHLNPTLRAESFEEFETIP